MAGKEEKTNSATTQSDQQNAMPGESQKKNGTSANEGRLAEAMASVRKNDYHIKHPRIHKLITQTIPNGMNVLAVLLSFGLIAIISWDIYKAHNFLENNFYMKYQFIVCLIFLAEYVFRFFITIDKLKFFFITLPFVLIAIPYLNLIQYYGYYVSPETMHYLRFVPIIRGLVALIVLVNFVSKNIATTLFASYVLVIVPFVYMSGLFFYVAENGLNPGIKNFWYALWWAGMNVTTIGCNINPITATGMILGFLLSLLGIIMLPIFTVYLGDMFQHFNKNDAKKKP